MGGRDSKRVSPPTASTTHTHVRTNDAAYAKNLTRGSLLPGTIGALNARGFFFLAFDLSRADGGRPWPRRVAAGARFDGDDDRLRVLRRRCSVLMSKSSTCLMALSRDLRAVSVTISMDAASDRASFPDKNPFSPLSNFANKSHKAVTACNHTNTRHRESRTYPT